MIQQFDLKKEYAILEDEIQNELKKVFSKNSGFYEMTKQRFIAINGIKNIHKLNFLI